MKTYSYNGTIGVLLDDNNKKVSGIKPMEWGANKAFYSLKSLKGVELADDDIRVTDEEGYCGEFIDNEVPILCTEIVSPYNEQCIVCGWVTVDYAANDEYEREMLTLTDRYCHWTSKLSELVNSLCDAYYPNEDMEALREERKRLRPDWDNLRRRMEKKRGEYTEKALPISKIIEKYVL